MTMARSGRTMRLGALVAASLMMAAHASPVLLAQVSTPPPTSALATRRQVEHLQRYQRQLADRLTGLPDRASLAVLIQEAMAVAAANAAGAGAADENRTALVVLMFHVNGWPIERLAPDAGPWPSLPRRTYRLRGRDDLAQHFIVSAALAATAGLPVATLAGIYKELTDTRGASGFSFSDLAADRAGALFGLRATRDDDSAARTQRLASRNLAEDDFMPAVADLPDNLSEERFIASYGGVEGRAYAQMVDDIDRRITALRMFR